MARVRSFLLRAALLCTSLLLSLLAVEMVLRLGLLSRGEVRSTAITERATSKMHEPDFRRPGFEIRSKDGAFRIVVVGDSFAWGDGVYAEDAFPHRLEQRLNAVSRGDRFEVINWSRPGWNTVRQVRSLEPRLPELQPDLLILSFVLNDAEPLERSALQRMLSRAEGRQPAPGLSAWLYGRSRLYALVWTRLENSRTHGELSSFYRSLFEGEHWQACRKALRRLRNRARAGGTQLILVIFPVFDSPMNEAYPYLDLHQRIRQEAEVLEIPVLDLMDVYRGMDTARLAVHPFTNAHPTEIAHRIAADGILDYLVRHRLIPPVDHKPRRRKPSPGK